MFMVLSSWQSHCESSPGSFDECRTAPSGRRPKTKPDDLVVVVVVVVVVGVVVVVVRKACTRRRNYRVTSAPPYRLSLRKQKCLQ